MFDHNVKMFVNFRIFYSDSQPIIDYIEKFIVQPLIRTEKKSHKIIIPQKDRKTLETICGIIETNASYLTFNNSIAGNFLSDEETHKMSETFPSIEFTFFKVCSLSVD